MPSGNRRFVAAIAGLAIAVGTASLLAWSLYPEQPKLSGLAAKQEQRVDYRAGGTDCQPSEIGLLAGRERARRSIACQEAEEQHRLQTNDLIQQRRSADAADAMTVLSYQQTGIAAWGMALGFITMAAAIAAAFYARSAAVHSDKSHKAFINAERAILRVVEASEGNLSGDGHDGIQGVIAVKFRNIGRTSARIVTFGSKVTGSATRWADVPAGGEVVVAGPALPDAHNIVLDGWFWIEYTLVGGSAGTTNFRLSGRWHGPDGPFRGGWFFDVTNLNGHPDDT